MFADDTTLIARQKDQPEMEKLLVKVLRDWGETVHPTKTERIQAGGRDPSTINAGDENHCLKETKLLGSWLDEYCLNDKDSAVRLAAAQKLWGKVYSQLPRLGLSLLTQGKLIKATVFACLLYGCEVRSFTSKQIQ
eukprot:113349-Heterocapsa_arctica.AAC.1